MYECPQHHQSETAEFCSVCGVEIAPVVALPPVLSATGHCPQCGAAKDSDGQIFCELCGYNFKTARPGVPGPMVAPAVETPPVAVGRWDVIASTDPNLYGTPNPEAPTDRPDQTFSIFEPENIIGRAAPGVRVQVPVSHDPGISRRHAVLLRTGNGLSVRDLGSANGTQLNGVELTAGVETPLKHGDVVSIGAWTRLTVRAVSQ